MLGLCHFRLRRKVTEQVGNRAKKKLDGRTKMPLI